MLSGEKEEKAKEERRRRETGSSVSAVVSLSLSDLPMIDDAMRMGGA